MYVNTGCEMRSESPFDDLLTLVKGAGDLATGVAWRLHRCGVPVVMTELARPYTVRRAVAFAQAVFAEEHEVEGITARRTLTNDVPDVLDACEIPVVVDPEGEAIEELAPSVVVDAAGAQTNAGTSLASAPLVVALGPGFIAGVDCHAVIETARGHNLGRAIWGGEAGADTEAPPTLPGLPAAEKRTLRAPSAGRLEATARVGDLMPAGGIIGAVVQPSGQVSEVAAPFTGVLRGLVHGSVELRQGLKIGDLDPRCSREDALRISDRALAVGGGVLETFLHWHFGRSDSSVSEEIAF